MTESEPQRPRRQVRRPGSPRAVVHKVKVSADVEARLKVKASERGWTVSRLLVESALAGGADAAAARTELAGEMFRLTRLFGSVGNNINQLARKANATGQIDPGTGPALAAMARMEGRLAAMLADIDGGGRPDRSDPAGADR